MFYNPLIRQGGTCRYESRKCLTGQQHKVIRNRQVTSSSLVVGSILSSLHGFAISHDWGALPWATLLRFKPT
jgi:hypothetical protein